MTRHRGAGATGGTRPRADKVERFAHPVGPVPGQAALLRALLTKRLDVRARTMASSMLRRAEAEPLSAAQQAWLQREAKAYGAVDEGPDVHPVPVGCVGVESWGVLPARPPGRRA